jgi:hypothetical protein
MRLFSASSVTRRKSFKTLDTWKAEEDEDDAEDAKPVPFFSCARMMFLGALATPST